MWQSENEEASRGRKCLRSLRRGKVAACRLRHPDGEDRTRLRLSICAPSLAYLPQPSQFRSSALNYSHNLSRYLRPSLWSSLALLKFNLRPQFCFTSSLPSESNIAPFKKFSILLLFSPLYYLCNIEFSLSLPLSLLPPLITIIVSAHLISSRRIMMIMILTAIV